MRSIPVLLSLGAAMIVGLHPIFAQDASWPTSTPEAQGMNSATLTTMLDDMAEFDESIHSIVVIRNGYLVLEAYNYPYTAADLHTSYSVTKSVNSAVLGIAVDKGYISSLQQPMLDFFPDYTPANLDDAKKSITLENLLTMTPGFDWPGGMNEPLLGDMMDTDNWIHYTLDRPVKNQPGQLFVYNSAVSSLLAAITEQASGQHVLDFAQANLFDPLGIHNVKWASDPQGHNLGGFGLQLTPRDMAKIGYLYLNNGQWDGQQIISSEWVAASTQKHVNARPLADGYGYQWWVSVHGYYMAIGYGGQYIIVDPSHNLVVVFTSATPVGRGAPQETYLQKNILPAIESDQPLPDNPDGVGALQTAVENFATPKPQAVPALPDTAVQISGQTFQLASNDFGWESLALNFDDPSTAQLSLNGEAPLSIGLDGVDRINHVTDAKSIFAIGFDNILRVYPVAGEEPMLIKGSWAKDTRFVMTITLQGTVNSYLLTFNFKDDTVSVTVRNSLSGNSKSVTGTLQS